MSDDKVIDVRGLTKKFGDKTVDHSDIAALPRRRDLRLSSAQWPGKTTTIRMICGPLTPDEGEGTCLGFDVRREAGKKELVGYMTQYFLR
ncbi:hypothetical protein FPZ08_00020 [Devosia ginsengisoli]|uniref:ATP-binding cassette domain-containing protein n=1 Tax=Devosia ginsengisoli TaxID=400770 RepID=A0A5B8LMF2_9HYPH|nr:hypothetical protein FPZ08_00020 [Devosia ginsengisoli]